MPARTKQVKPKHVIALRERVRLTPEQFADRLLVSRVTVWRWEKGKSSPSEVHLRQMRTLWGFSLGVTRK